MINRIDDGLDDPGNVAEADGPSRADCPCCRVPRYSEVIEKSTWPGSPGMPCGSDYLYKLGLPTQIADNLQKEMVGI